MTINNYSTGIKLANHWAASVSDFCLIPLHWFVSGLPLLHLLWACPIEQAHVILFYSFVHGECVCIFLHLHFHIHSSNSLPSFTVDAQ